MRSIRQQRVRDPVHGLIVFPDKGVDARRDQTAWELLNTPEFQRLRRIRQLGVTEFTFPGATHTRFSHSIGVFHTARMLVGVLRRLLPDAEFDRDRADLAVLTALLHDLGHGPLSHAFETVQKAVVQKNIMRLGRRK
jgi:HD superfamily phosphohydrolase